MANFVICIWPQLKKKKNIISLKRKKYQLIQNEVLPPSHIVGWSLWLGASIELSLRGICANQQALLGVRTSPSQAGQPSD